MHSSRVLISVFAMGLAVAGCKGKDKAAGTGSGSGSGPGTSAGSGSGTGTGTGTGSGTGSAAGAPEEALPPLPAADEVAVRKVVDAWLAAQNGGDFAAYQALYAEKMEGVKRVGARTSRFDRKGWLADRQRMFKHKMTVGARDITIRGSATAANVSLVQTFQQGKFSDEGPKQLTVIKGPSGYLIAREEMLRSDLGGTVAPVGPGALLLVMEVDSKPYVVIQAEASAAWGQGRVLGPFDGAHMFAMRDASQAGGAASWQGRALVGYAADGSKCNLTVGALRLVAGGTPHFGEVQMWEGDEGEPPLTPAQRARAVYDLSTPYLVGELTGAACKPIFAMDPTATPTVWATAATDDALETAATNAFRKLPAYTSLQEEFTGSFEGRGPWAPTPDVDSYVSGNRRYVIVSASEGNGCGEFYGQVIAIFEQRGAQLALVAVNPGDAFLRVAALVDSNGDGKVELVGAADDFRMVTAHFTPSDDVGFAPTTEVTFPYSDCGC